jgi:hypothetical protein
MPSGGAAAAAVAADGGGRFPISSMEAHEERPPVAAVGEEKLKGLGFSDRPFHFYVGQMKFTDVTSQ